jgi:acyl carrier protein
MTLQCPSQPFVRALVAQACELTVQDVRAQDRLVEDLRIDSLELAGLLVDIETTCGVVIDAAVVQRLRTVADLEAAVRERGAARP